MKKILILMLFLITFVNAQYDNWKNKTSEQLSGITSGSTNIASKNYWTTQAYAQLKVLFDLVGDMGIEATDTTSLKAMPADTSLKIVYLSQSGLEGWFVKIDSANSESTTDYFDCATSGKQWARLYLGSNGLASIGRFIGQKIVKDTTTLKAYTVDSVGTTVYLKQLASGNTNGGGDFILADSTDLKALIGTAVANSTNRGVILHAPGADKVWVRREFLDTYVVQVDWWGCVADGSTDDAAKIQAAWDFAELVRAKGVKLGDGTYKINTEIDMGVTAAGTGLLYNLGIEGNGPENTQVKLGSTLGFLAQDPGHAGGAKIYRPWIKNLTIVGRQAQNDTAVYINQANQGIYQNIHIDSCFYGILIRQSELQNFTNISTDSCAYGFFLFSNSNGNSFTSISPGYSRTAGYYQKSCQGNILNSPDIGNQAISIFADSTSTLTIEGGNFESHTTAALRVGSNSVLSSIGSRFLKGTPSGIIAKLSGSALLILDAPVWSGWAATDSLVSRFNHNDYVSARNLKRTQVMLGYDESSAIEFPISYFVNERSQQMLTRSVGPERGKLYTVYNDEGATPAYADAIVYGQGIADGTIWPNVLTDGTDWRFTTDGNTCNDSARVDRFRIYQGYNDFTAAADTVTLDTVYTDTLGVTAFKYIGHPQLYRTDAAGGEFIVKRIMISSFSTTTGAVVFRIIHPQETAGTKTLRLFYDVTVQAKHAGKW